MIKFFLLLLFSLSLNTYADDRFKPTFNFYAASGQIKGVTLTRILAENEDVDTATTPEDVIYAGGVYVWPTSAAATTIVSSSTNDASGGTGCRTVTITGLDANYNLVIQSVTLNGTTPVSLTTNLFRVNNSICTSSGTGESNAGNIDVLHTSNILSRIPTGYGQSSDGIYTVPSGYKFYIDRFSCGASRSGSGNALIYAYVKPFTTKTWTFVSEFPLLTQGTSASDNSPPNGRFFLINGKTDVKITVKSVDANNMGFNCQAAGFLVKDDSIVY